jgi:hypothetical protein
MRFVFRLVVLASCICALSARGEAVVDFDDLTVPVSGYFNGDPGERPIDQSWQVSTPWVSGSVSFANTAGRDVGVYDGWSYNYTYWQGFAYSNVVNTTDGIFTNQYASKPGGGVGGPGTTYAIAYGDGATIQLPVPTTVSGFRIANTTYAYGVMTVTDPNGFSVPLASGTGWFAVTATGKLGTTTTGSATFYLADLRGASPAGILGTWAWFDLVTLGNVDTVEFTFDGSDKHPTFGLNTPAYFAMDNLTVAAVPEPATWALLAGGAATALLATRRSTRDRRASRVG